MWCPSLCLETWYILKSIVSDMSITTSAFFWFPFPWNTFFHPLTFRLYVPYIWNWSLANRINMGPVLVAIQPVYFFCFEHVIPLSLRWLSVCMFLKPFCSLILICFHRSFSSLLLLFSSLVIWWLSLVLCLNSFSFFCVCIYCRL